MKKQYFKLKIKLIMLVFSVVLVGLIVLTYFKADEIEKDTYSRCQEYNDFAVNLRMLYWETPEDIIKQTYYEYNKINLSNESDIGFYSMLKDESGNTLAEEQNFLIIQKDSEYEDFRIVLLGDDVVSEDEYVQHSFQSLIHSMEITGTCDDTFVYLEELKWKQFEGEKYSYVPKVDYTMKGEMSFEEWAGANAFDDIKPTNEFYCTGTHFTKDYFKHGADEKLDAKAKKLCLEIYEDFVNDIDTRDDQSEYGLFTCVVAGTGFLDDGYAVPYVFVFHPVSMAMNELTTIYIGAAFLVIIVCSILCSLINKVYRQQFAYEMNRRELTRGIAHELKTPLAITKGYIENWKYMNEQDKEESSQTIVEEIEHMNTMVMDLLELSRLEAKVKEINLDSVDLHSLAKSVLSRMKEMIDEKGLQVNITPEEGQFLVDADLEMIRTVLVNFISNAIKYSDKKIDINIFANGNKIKFVIENDGKTIETKKIVNVWKEFYREGYSNDHHMGSSGLGLAITKNILILHNAKYGCDSKDGKTEFWFEMKRSTQE